MAEEGENRKGGHVEVVISKVFSTRCILTKFCSKTTKSFIFPTLSIFNDDVVSII